MLESILISICVAFCLRTLAHMVIYSLTYGQIFGFIKLWMGSQVFPDIYTYFQMDKQSENEEISTQVYDEICEVKYKNYPTRQIFWSYVFSLLDCVYCVGFWLSFITSIILICTGQHWVIILTTPIFTYFFTEKI